MKYRLYAALGFSFALVIASARGLFAGVVMAETSTSTSPDGQSESQVKTIYVQGNKQKIERQDVAAITDLDKSLIYIVDKQHHEYAEIPLHNLHPSRCAMHPGTQSRLTEPKGFGSWQIIHAASTRLAKATSLSG